MTNHGLHPPEPGYNCPKCGRFHTTGYRPECLNGLIEVVCRLSTCRFAFTAQPIKTVTVFKVRCITHEFDVWKDLPGPESYQVRVCIRCMAAEARDGA